MQWEQMQTALRERVRQQARRQAQPSAAIIDSQSVKTTQVGGERGYDGGKKVNGRKRHSLVDTMGNLLRGVVHAANIQDREGATLLLEDVPDELLARMDKLWADGGYDGDLADWMENEFTHWRLELVQRPADTQGFVLLPRRWVVERTFAWLGRFRRLSKDYEKCLDHSMGMVYLAEIRRMLKQLARSN